VTVRDDVKGFRNCSNKLPRISLGGNEESMGTAVDSGEGGVAKSV
jgi:hypothetical protein